MNPRIDEVTGYKLCKRGHERTPENLEKSGMCKECAKERKRRPEVAAAHRAQEKARAQTQEYKDRKKVYIQRPDRKEHAKKYRQSAKYKSWQTEYSQTASRKESVKKYRQSQKYKNRMKEYYQADEVKNRAKLRREGLTDGYIVHVLQCRRTTVTEIHPAMIGLKRMMIKLTRAKRAYLKGERHEQAQ